MPTFNEMQHGYIQRSLPLYQGQNIELIVVDGGSTDSTQTFLEENNIQFLVISDSTRLKRIQKGIELTTGAKIIIHHPRTILNIPAFDHLLNTKNAWGAFTHKFDHNHPLLVFTSLYSNFIRGDLRSIFYLDHCFYLDRSLKNKIIGLEDCEIFEDTEISKTLKNHSKGKRLSEVAQTSAIRFRKNGIFKQAFLNQKMKWMYYFNKDHRQMNKEYEKNLELNNETK